VPWPDATKRAFLDSQFSLLHGHLVSQIADVDFLVIERHGQRIGRYYVSRSDPMYIVNIALQTTARGLGLGSALTSDTLDQARTLGFGAMLHVLRQSVRAANLYRQLGFVVTSDSRTRAEMRWQATAV
jgi:ribosomal protein S18 acetylase RimI-like enzyme